MREVLSEDAVRCAFKDQPAEPLAQWQRAHLMRSVEPVLKEPWICDIDVTINTLYGQQEGAEVGYNTQKPGRPAHAYHTFFISRLRLAVDVVVAPGKQCHSRVVSQTFWSWWAQLPEACRSTDAAAGRLRLRQREFPGRMRKPGAPKALSVSAAGNPSGPRVD